MLEPLPPGSPDSGTLMEPHSFWLDNLRKYETLSRLKQSDFFARHGDELESFLRTAQMIPVPGARPLVGSFARVVQWNIEKGKRFKQILQRFRDDEVLRWADIIILNEADDGMIRSENRRVAREMAEELRMHAVFGPAHFELTKGTADELFLDGENTGSLQGNAVLSRYPIADARVVPLPVTFEPYEFEEKRFGARNCLWAKLQLGKSALWVGSVHLELRNTPLCRARQVHHILLNLPCADNEAVLLGGDLNTNSFSRGTGWRTLNSIVRLLIRSPERLKNELLHPESGGEPLFQILSRSGFEWDSLNSNEETARTRIDALEESGYLPDSFLRRLRKRLEPYQGHLCFKLDWFAGKNVRALKTGERTDVSTGVVSLKAGVAKGENYGPDRLSDHLPIYADFDLA
jgi:endonuclease/exonuclease/phosphatase family metal-dependent hydrolase